jgi:hypothetical protein
MPKNSPKLVKNILGNDIADVVRDLIDSLLSQTG